eukprot:3107344-Pyramimonas_sp.AAC.1
MIHLTGGGIDGVIVEIRSCHSFSTDNYGRANLLQSKFRGRLVHLRELGAALTMTPFAATMGGAKKGAAAR